MDIESSTSNRPRLKNIRANISVAERLVQQGVVSTDDEPLPEKAFAIRSAACNTSVMTSLTSLISGKVMYFDNSYVQKVLMLYN